jgi:hypothetical protein
MLKLRAVDATFYKSGVTPNVSNYIKCRVLTTLYILRTPLTLPKVDYSSFPLSRSPSSRGAFSASGVCCCSRFRSLRVSSISSCSCCARCENS